MEVKKQKTFLQYLSDALGIWGAYQVGKHFVEILSPSGSDLMSVLIVTAILVSLFAETSAAIRAGQFVPTLFILIVWGTVLKYPNDPSNSALIILGRVFAWILLGINFIDVGEWLFGKLSSISNWLSKNIFKPLKEGLNRLRENGP